MTDLDGFDQIISPSRDPEEHRAQEVLRGLVREFRWDQLREAQALLDRELPRVLEAEGLDPGGYFVEAATVNPRWTCAVIMCAYLKRKVHSPPPLSRKDTSS